MKKILKLSICFMLVISILAVPVAAGNVSYGFTLKNTKKTFNFASPQHNRKIHAGQNWVNTISGISFTDSTAYTSHALGIAFMPSDPVYGSGLISWRKSTGTVYTGWSSGGGGTGSYVLMARIDDVLTGTGSASGKWNSDSTY